jgi:hypothetical protein
MVGSNSRPATKELTCATLSSDAPALSTISQTSRRPLAVSAALMRAPRMRSPTRELTGIGSAPRKQFAHRWPYPVWCSVEM